MKERTLTMKEVSRIQAIRQCIDKVIDEESAARLLGLSVRHIQRLKKLLREYGAESFAHKNRGRPSNNKIPDKTKEKVLDLFKTKYNGFNMKHFTEKLNKDEKIKVSYETVRLKLTNHKGELEELGIHLKTKKQPKHRTRRERMVKEGILIQTDGSDHDWFENRERSTLMGIIDDATSKVDALFFEKETTIAYMTIFKKLIKEKGIPLAFYVDRHSSLKTTRHGGLHMSQIGDKPTQVERALDELGINLIFARSPQAKGRVERLFKTFQDRLVSELRLKKIKNIVDANIFLQSEFIPDFNKRFSVKPKEEGKVYRKIPKNADIDRIFSVKEKRTVNLDNTVSHKNSIYQILPKEDKKSYARVKVDICRFTGGEVHIYDKNSELEVKLIEKKEPKETKTLKLSDFMKKPTLTKHDIST